MSNSTKDVLQRVLREEATAIGSLADQLGDACLTMVDWMVECRGRVITCGIGKSGHIARKTAGTLSSTGTPSLFLHAAEAVHGDLGMVTGDDIVMAYSHSGETDEILRIFPSLRVIGARTVLVTGKPESSAARLADLVLNTAVQKEACAINLAPTTSTTVMLALSDALAVAAMERREFKREDFAVFHPSGSLGRRLLLRVAEVMRTGEDNALVTDDAPIMEVLAAITRAGAGAACVVDDAGKMIGIITDGDVRRFLLKGGNSQEGSARDIMSSTFSSISPDLLAVEALDIFQNHPKKLGEMPVLAQDGKPLGILMLKDLLRAGIV